MSHLQRYFEESLASLLANEAHFHKRFSNPNASDLLNTKYTTARFCVYIRSLYELKPEQAARSLVDKTNALPQDWYTKKQKGALARKAEALNDPMLRCAMKDAIAVPETGGRIHSSCFRQLSAVDRTQTARCKS